MSFNPRTQSIETKLYFVVFSLFSSFLAIVIYNFSFDSLIADDMNYVDVKVSSTPSPKEIPNRAVDNSESPGFIRNNIR